jgi:hypothetical protein
MSKRKGNFKYEIGSLVRYKDKKAQVLNHWWDGVANNRYEIRFMIGRNLVGDHWLALERNLERYDKK